MSTKKSQEPLLFIHQSFSMAPPNKNMQEFYSNRVKPEPIEDETVSERESKKSVSLAKKELLEEPAPKLENQENNLEKSGLKQAAQQIGKQRASMNRVKPFKEMDLFERLDYLINFPKVLPPVPCVFNTSEENYQGYLSEYNHQYITIKFYDETTKTIPLNELNNVMMIGIKR